MDHEEVEEEYSHRSSSGAPVCESPPNSNMEEVEAVADACKHLADGAGDAAISTKANVAKLKENVLLL